MLSRLICWFWGHAWRVIQESGGPQPLSHVPLLCDRCGRARIVNPDFRDYSAVTATPAYDPANISAADYRAILQRIDILGRKNDHLDYLVNQVVNKNSTASNVMRYGEPLIP